MLINPTENINPKTGLSVLFDKDHYTGRDKVKYQAKNEPPVTLKKAIKDHNEELLCLLAKGYSSANIIIIMNELYPNEFKNVHKDAIRTYLSRCAMFYSTHLDLLIDVIGNYEFRCKDILSKLNGNSRVDNIDNSISKVNDIENKYILDKSTDKVLDRIRANFSEIHDLILTYPDKLFDLEDIEKEIREQQTKVSNCRNFEDVTMYYQNIKSLYTKKANMKALKKNEEAYREAYMVKALKESGIDKAIKKFDKIMKNI